jgi:diguanylate cyclase (GGDEF)-like protein
MIFDRLPHTACSCPVLSSSGEFLGTISGCGFEVRQLDTCKELLELGSQLAALAIDNRRLIDNLEHRTRHDVLTGLPNRVQLDRRLTAALDAARETGEFVAVLYIDLDGFKRINDEFGHRIGDIFLRRTAERFRSSLRENDLLARVGGDEFVSISMGMRQPEDGLELVQRLLASLERPLNLAEGLALGCSASIGVAIYPRDGQTVEELERHADEAMYAAKAAGKGQFRSFDQRRNDSF